MSNPALDQEVRDDLVSTLMAARRAVAEAKRKGDAEAEQIAHAAVNETKYALGERGPVWWADGAPDFTRHLVKNTPYAAWYERVR